MPRSPQRMDLYQIWFRGSSRGRNQLCGILLQSAHGFRFCEGSKFTISHWLGWSPLTQCWRYRAACDALCAFNYIIYPIFVQCYVMGRFGHENGPFWMLAGAVLVLFFSSIGAVLVGAVLVCVGRFRPSLGPFWRWAVLVGSHNNHISNNNNSNNNY